MSQEKKAEAMASKATGGLFSSSEAREKRMEAWKKIAERKGGNSLSADADALESELEADKEQSQGFAR